MASHPRTLIETNAIRSTHRSKDGHVFFQVNSLLLFSEFIEGSWGAHSERSNKIHQKCVRWNSLQAVGNRLRQKRPPNLMMSLVITLTAWHLNRATA